MGRSVALVVNPTSGRGRAGRLAVAARDRIRSLGAEVEVLASASPDHATEIASEAAGRHDVVAAMGGDGMVGFVANGLIGARAALGIVPTGTGNDFAANLGYPRREALAACAIVAGGTERVVDVGRVVGGRAFVCVAGGGFDSEVNRAANRIRLLRGTPVYVAAVLRTLAAFRPARFRVTLDEQVMELEGLFVAVGNAASYGGGMRIAPAAVLDDGLFDVCVVGAMGRAALLRQFPRLFKGTHVSHPAVTIRRAREVTIEADREFFLYADGEEVGRLPARMRVEPGALRVVAP